MKNKENNMHELQKLCKEILYPFVRVEIERDAKNKLYYCHFISTLDRTTITIGFKQMKDKEHLKELVEKIRETLG